MKKLLSILLKIMEFITDYKGEIVMVVTFVPIILMFCYLAFTVSIQFGFSMIIGFILAGIFICSENIADFLKEKGVE